MQSKASTPKEYIDSLPVERREAIAKLHSIIVKNLPAGFEETMAYGMVAWVIPHSLYPQGYHVNPKQPLMMLSLASQKNYISLHHMALYEGPLLKWFSKEWEHSSSKKLDMGKCCVRFQSIDDIPLDLIGVLASKLTPQRYIALYEEARSRVHKRPSRRTTKKKRA